MDERPARAELRRQIGRLERQLAQLVAEAFPRLTLEVGVPAAARGPRLIGLGELEQLRDALAGRVAAAREALREKEELETKNRELLERMLAAPEQFKWLRISRAEVGEPGCGSWYSSPRFGLLGMLMGWWQVKVSSGCPLAARPAAARSLEAKTVPSRRAPFGSPRSALALRWTDEWVDRRHSALTIAAARRCLVGGRDQALHNSIPKEGEMTSRRPMRRRLGRFAKLASLAAALSLFAAPLALAGTEPPEGVPPSYNGEENPGGEYLPTGVPPEVTPPEGTAPEGLPLGPPEGLPLGPPEGLPPSPEVTVPEGVTLGPPEGVQPGSPEGTPPAFNGSENPGAAQRLSAAEARALGREQCQEFKKNFGENKSQFGKCVADLAKALHGSAAPGRACANMNRKPEEGEHRSDFSACVAAAAQALREAHE